MLPADHSFEGSGLIAVFTGSLLPGLQGLPAAFVDSRFACFLDDTRTLQPGTAASKACTDLMTRMGSSYVDTTTETYQSARQSAGTKGEKRCGEDPRMADFCRILLMFFKDLGLDVLTVEPVLTSKASCIQLVRSYMPSEHWCIPVLQGSVGMLHIHASMSNWMNT